MLSVRTTKSEDLKWVIDAESNPENSNFVNQWTFEKHRNSLQDEDIKHLLILDSDQNKVGYIILAGLENENNSIEFRRLVITDKNKGYGKFAIKEILRLSFTEYSCHRLWLDVRIHNTKAINLYEKLGFKREGLLRECEFSNDSYESLYLYSILKNEYRKQINSEQI